MARQSPTLTSALRLSEESVRLLEWAERKRSWFLYRALLDLLHALGAKVMRTDRGDYLIEYDYGESDGA
jgi:hypothetical protein